MERMIESRDIKHMACVERIKQLEEENKKLKEQIDKTNELLNNAGRCSEQYREKMINVMEELKTFLYKD